MKFSKINTVFLNGFKAEPIVVETDVTRGLFHFSIVGLPDKSVEESRDRICAAIKNSGFDSPKTKHHKITSSLVPAHVKKIGSSFDLPIAISYLKSIGVISANLDSCVFIGELSLDGRVRPAKGMLQIILFAALHGFKNIFIPPDNLEEARLALRLHESVRVFTPIYLLDIVNHFKKEAHLALPELKNSGLSNNTLKKIKERRIEVFIDLGDIQGQEISKRAALIAIAGGHNLFLIGTPGTGKTLIAKACAGLQPAPTPEEAIEIASIHSLHTTKKEFDISNIQRPFRAPHHTSSYSAMVGGGSDLLPGEISLAHNGILFMDEFPEFDRRVIESLREPLEEGIIKIARAKHRGAFPANIILIAAANPCPCGYRGSLVKRCVCKPSDIRRYSKKISGPIIDRIDIVVRVDEQSIENNLPLHTSTNNLTKSVHTLNSELARKLIAGAKILEAERTFRWNIKAHTNAKIPFEKIFEIVDMDEEAGAALEKGAKQLLLSMRAKHRAIRVARTIADLEGSIQIKAPHILEALSFRFKDEE